MTDLWKEVASWLAEATRSAIKETEDLARRGRLKVDVLGINTALQDKFATLGGIIYSMAGKKQHSSAIFKDPRIRKLLEEIAELETSLKEARKTETVPQTKVVERTPARKKASRSGKSTIKKESATTHKAVGKGSKNSKSKK